VFGYVARCQRDHQDLITLDPVAYGEPGARLCASTGALGRRGRRCALLHTLSQPPRQPPCEGAAGSLALRAA